MARERSEEAARLRKRAVAERVVYASLVSAVLAALLGVVVYVTRSGSWLASVLFIVGVVIAALALMRAGALQRRSDDDD